MAKGSWHFMRCSGYDDCRLVASKTLDGRDYCTHCFKVAVMEAALHQYVIAQGRMRDRWAEGDEAVKRMLWQELHACEEAGRAALAEVRGEAVSP